MTGLRLPKFSKIPAWHEDALCRRRDRDDYFTTSAELAAEVTMECAVSCPVREACLRWAFEVRDTDAILGGSTPRQRKRALRRTHGDPQAAARLIVEGRIV